MKKNLFMVAAVAFVALVSCNKETNSSLQPAPVSDIKFEAEIAQTKTAIGDPDETGYRNVTWVIGDEVNINGTLFTATGKKEDGKAIFETKNLDFTVAEQYDAIYPATAGKSLEAVTIPTEQDGTFANAAIAVAQSENRSLSFLNVASLLRFQVPASYASVTIESTANLAGTVSVSFNEELPVIGEVKNASKTVTLKNVKAGVDYYVAILPGDHKFTVNIDGRLSKEASKTLTATRAGILSLGKLPKPVDYKLYIEDDTEYSELYLYLYDASGNDNTWPGAEITDTETINGVTYKVYTVPEDQNAKEYTYIFNNNKNSQVEENKKIKFDKNNYLRVTKKYSEVVDASNKGKSDPITLYIRNDKNWSKLNYYMWIPGGATNAGWPGQSVDMTKKTKIDNATYYYVELGAHSYTRIIINDGSNQTADMTIKSTTEDIYAANNGYCWKGSEQNL